MSSGSWPLTLAAVSLVLSAAQPSANGGPLIEDDRQWFDSENGRFFAVPGPKKKSTIVFRRMGPPGAVERVWEMPGWLDSPFLSDDGEYLVWCRGGPSGRRRKVDEVMVSIFSRGAPVAVVRLNQIVMDVAKMGPHPTAWYPWGDCKGFVGLHDFSLLTLESRRLIYEVTTGKLVEEVFVDRGKPRSETTMDDLWDEPPIGRTLPTSGRKAAPPETCCREGTGGRPANPRAPAP